MSIPVVVKIGVDSAATAAGKLDAWAKSAEKAFAAGEEINLIEDAIRGIKFFGQVNIALQCLSMGLTAIGFLQGGKSAEAQILDGIDRVLGRIKTLEADVHAQFDQLARDLLIQTGQLQLQPYLVKIKAAEDHLAQISVRKAAGTDFSTLEDELADNFNPVDFEQAVLQIHDSCVGTGTPTSPNILSALYDRTYGDIRKIWPVGEYLLQKAASAVMLHGVVGHLHSVRAKTAFDAAQIASLYDDNIKDAAAAVEKWTGDCVSAAERPKNIKRFLDDKKVFPLSILVDDKQATSARIADNLQDLYTYLNFSVIVYEPVSGYDHHGVAGSNTLTQFHFVDVVSKPLNMIIYWANRTATNRQAKITYQSAVVDWHSFPGPRKDRSFDVATFNSWPNRPPGARYQFAFDLAGEANRSTNNSPFLGDWGHKNKDLGPILDKYLKEQDPAKCEPNSVIWFNWTDNYQDRAQTNIGMTSYNAMYGLVAPYTMICFWEQ